MRRRTSAKVAAAPLSKIAGREKSKDATSKASVFFIRTSINFNELDAARNRLDAPSTRYRTSSANIASKLSRRRTSARRTHPPPAPQPDAPACCSCELRLMPYAPASSSTTSSPGSTPASIRSRAKKSPDSHTGPTTISPRSCPYPRQALLHRHNLMVRLVQRRPDQVVHPRVRNDERASRRSASHKAPASAARRPAPPGTAPAPAADAARPSTPAPFRAAAYSLTSAFGSNSPPPYSIQSPPPASTERMSSPSSL